MNDQSNTKTDTAATRAKPADLKNVRVGIIGLGYVGLPLAVYMARHFPVVGFDVNQARVGELAKHRDRTGEVTDDEFAAARQPFLHRRSRGAACLQFLCRHRADADRRGEAARPHGLDARERNSRPRALAGRCGGLRIDGLSRRNRRSLRADPGERVRASPSTATFFVGYSPERINPGDQQHRLPSIVKVTSGSTPEAADLVDQVYGSVVTAGTHKVSSIRVAEAAKVIENIQRDVNIALINELAMLFKDLGLDTREVLAAAGTKWNFHAYRPGLVGGHCIGVDPYYLTHKAQSIGFHPEMILAGRRINDGMAGFVARDIIKAMLHRKLKMDDAKVLVMGFTFKENVPDTRNTKVVDLVRELGSFLNVVVYDPVADRDDALHEYGIGIVPELPDGHFEAVVLAVKHREIMALGRDRLGALLAPGGLIYDITGVLAPGESDARI